MHDLDRARSALHAIDPGLPRDQWHEAGRAAIAAGLDVDDLVEWSRCAANFKNEADVRSAFRTITQNGKTGPGTLFHLAKQHGWANGSERPHSGPKRTTERTEKPEAISPLPAEIFAACGPAPLNQEYIARKLGLPDDVRVYHGDLRIAGRAVDGWLAVPVLTLAGEIGQIQFIGPDKKLFLPGALPKDGHFLVGGKVTDTLYIVEGIGQAWAVHQVTGKPAAVCFGAGRMAAVAKALRARYPALRLVIVPDAGKTQQAADIAASIGGQYVDLPLDWPANRDINDEFVSHGQQAVRDILANVKTPAKPEIGLDVAFADELPSDYEPPREIVQGMLTEGGGSVLYGDSNSGKTFLAIDLAVAVARGVEWMGCRTVQGLVVYIAAESPASVRTRLRTYAKYHGVLVPDFAIVQSAINLFEGDADTTALIDACKSIADQRGKQIRLIVGDTLARLSAGANENAGQDMGLVVRRFDRIRAETGAHFLLIHHSGKVQANGARGWSGLRAAVDAEFEVTDGPTGRCLEVTKQRDLPSKGDRIGFRLEAIEIGLTQWGTPARSCIVLPADAPAKVTKRMGEIEGAIVEHLTARGTGITKSELAKHLSRYDKGSVYRAIRKLDAAGIIVTVAGIVALPGRAS